MGSFFVRELTDITPDDQLGHSWEALARTNPASGIMQSLLWAEVKRRQGLRTLHLGLFEGEELIGGMLAYSGSADGGAGMLVVPEGPVLPWEDEGRARSGLRLLLQAAEERAPAVGALALRIEPRLPVPRPQLLRNFSRAPVDLLPLETLYLDLLPGPEQLLAAMRPKGRYNIRLAARKGVTVRELCDPSAEDLRMFHLLMNAAGVRDGFYVEPHGFFVPLFDVLCGAGLARLFIAEHEGQPLGTLFLTTYGHRATYLYGGIGNAGRNLMAGYALQWAAIVAAQSAGCAIYDFYGYESTGDPNHAYASFSRFKRQFGGEAVQFVGAHDSFFLDQLADTMIKVLREGSTS